MNPYLHSPTRLLLVALPLLLSACASPELHPAIPAPVPPFQREAPSTSSQMVSPQLELPKELFAAQDPAKIRLIDMGIRTADTAPPHTFATLAHKHFADQIPGGKMTAGTGALAAPYSFQEANRRAQKMGATHMLTSFTMPTQNNTDHTSTHICVITEITDVENGLIIFRHQYDCPVEMQPPSTNGRSGTAGK